LFTLISVFTTFVDVLKIMIWVTYILIS
jgi:hypothetical protein